MRNNYRCRSACLKHPEINTSHHPDCPRTLYTEVLQAKREQDRLRAENVKLRRRQSRPITEVKHETTLELEDRLVQIRNAITKRRRNHLHDGTRSGCSFCTLIREVGDALGLDDKP